jgi:hypothetical protein
MVNLGHEKLSNGTLNPIKNEELVPFNIIVGKKFIKYGKNNLQIYIYKNHY